VLWIEGQILREINAYRLERKRACVVRRKQNPSAAAFAPVAKNRHDFKRLRIV
jgi:hypothetical protein